MEHNDILPLVSQLNNRLKATSLTFKRFLYHDIDWRPRLIGIKGSRGVGKTTLLLQHIKESFSRNIQQVFFASLDDIWFQGHSLVDLAEYLSTHNYTHLFLDEVHKYPDWNVVIKTIYDSFPSLHIVYTGSSMLEIDNSKSDLSRRQILYTLPGLSFREFLEFEGVLKMEPLPLEQILSLHQSVAMQVTSNIKVLTYFERYLRVGCFPFYKETFSEDEYYGKIRAIINLVVESDMPAVEDVSYSTVQKTKQLLMTIAPNVPLVPNISKLSQQLETNSPQCLKLLYTLDRANIIRVLSKRQKDYKHLSKPDKILLNNSNLLYALSARADVGTCRESFMVHQLATQGEVSVAPKGDFLFEDTYLFEVGGRGKDYSQIADVENSFLAVADTEVGVGSRIPLWMFGLMY